MTGSGTSAFTPKDAVLFDLYTSLAGITRNDTTIGSGGLLSFTQTTTGSYNLHQVRAGLNYHTDWLAAHPTVVAKY